MTVSVLESLEAVRIQKALAAARAETAAAKAARRPDFYSSPQWRRLRHDALAAADGKCVLCGARGGAGGVVLHVDHIEPISKNPVRRLDPSNLQVLCESCNMGKGNRSTRDWRMSSAGGAKLRVVR